MIQDLPKKAREPRKKALIFAGREREAYRWARDNGYLGHEWESVRRTRDLEGLWLDQFEAFTVGRWNLNYEVCQAWGLYLQHQRAQASK